MDHPDPTWKEQFHRRFDVAHRHEPPDDSLPAAVTPYYAGLIETPDATDPLYRQCIPHPDEQSPGPFRSVDPLDEDAHMPVPRLIHRYRDRAVLLTTSTCFVHCRHCMRRRTEARTIGPISERELKTVIDYLGAHPELRDVIVSGGDPLTLDDEPLDRMLTALRSVPTLEILRIGTRAPATLPMRVTDALTERLSRRHPLYVNTHFNHPRELTEASKQACERLANAGIPLSNQTVLLRGVNDHADTLEALFRGLLRMRVRPYYLFQCDLVKGTAHFRVPIEKGLELMEQLRARLDGLAIPQYAVDLPGARGKTPLLPEYIDGRAQGHLRLRLPGGGTFDYPDG